MARATAVSRDFANDDSSDAGPSSRPSSTSNRGKKAAPVPSIEIEKSAPPIKRVKKNDTNAKKLDLSANFPDFSTPFTPSYSYSTSTTEINQPSSGRSVPASSSLTLVNSPETPKSSNPDRGKRKVSSDKVTKAKVGRKKKGRKADSPDSDRTARSSSSSLSPLPSPVIQKSSLILDEDESDGDLSEQDLATFLASLPDKSTVASEVKNEEVEIRETFRPSRLPEGVFIDSSVYVRDQTCFWPGRVIAFHPAKTLAEFKANKDRWEIEDRFGKVRKVPFERVITMKDKRIADCTLGQVKFDKVKFSTDAATRAYSPPPESSDDLRPFSIPPDQFKELATVEQLRFIRSHLLRVIEESYTPSLSRIEAFFGGNKARDKLSQEAQYGNFSEDEVQDVIVPELERWALRGGKPKALLAKTESTKNDDSRPKGSDRYNALPESTLRKYISDILVPEAIIELCIRSYTEDELLAGDGDEVEKEDPQLDAEGDEVILSLVRSSVQGNEGIAVENSTSAGQLRPETYKSSQIQPGDDSIPKRNELYRAARTKLREQSLADSEKEWTSRSTELRDARRRMRKQLGMPDEFMNDYDKKVWAHQQGLKTGWASGRMREKMWYGNGKPKKDARNDI